MIIVQVELSSHAQRKEALPPAFAVLIFFWEFDYGQICQISIQAWISWFQTREEMRCKKSRSTHRSSSIIMRFEKQNIPVGIPTFLLHDLCGLTFALLDRISEQLFLFGFSNLFPKLTIVCIVLLLLFAKRNSSRYLYPLQCRLPVPRSPRYCIEALNCVKIAFHSWLFSHCSG